MALRTLMLASCLLAAAGCAQPLTEEQKRERDVAGAIQGFADQKTVDQATFSMTTVEYFGGATTRTEIKNGKVTITRTGVMLGGDQPPPKTEKTYTLAASDQQAWANLINVIVRDKLWDQGDVKTSGVADGGEVRYEFKVGEHEGKFTLVNSSPEHLYVFTQKAAYLTNLIEARLSGSVPKK